MIRRLIVVASVAALAGCAQPASGPVASGSRVYFGDLQGAAKVCTVPEKVALTPGQQAEATMLVGNDGGWCGIPVALSSGLLGTKAYDAGLLVQRPEHGRVHVRKIGDQTRVDYIPDAAFGGTDAFTVRFLPGNPALRVAVTVQYTAPPAPPAPPVRTPPARTPTRRR